MKLFIAITLFVAVSALPRPDEPDSDEAPILIRHWEPIPESDDRKHQNRRNRIENIINTLPFKPSKYFEDRLDRKITSEDIINALNVLYKILNNRENSDDAIFGTNDGEDENQLEIATDSDEEAEDIEPPSNKPDSDEENVDDGEQKPSRGNDEQPEDVENLGEAAGSGPENPKFVNFLQRPNISPSFAPEGSDFRVPKFVQMQQPYDE